MSEVQEPKVKITVAAAGHLLFKRVMTILMVTVIATIVVYACLAATIIRVVPATNVSGINVVKENTFVGGEVPSGQLAMVNPNLGTDGAVGTDFFDRLVQGVLPNTNASVVEVLAGPYADISWMETGLVQIDDTLMDVYVEEPETADGESKEHLSGEYLVRCIEGDCVPGEGRIVSEDSFYGILVDQEFSNATEENNEVNTAS